MPPRATGAAVALILISTAFVLALAPAPAQASKVALTGKYIMAFLACDTSTSACSNPQNHATHLAESNDSVNWSPVPGFKPYSGSVPDAIRRGNTIYVYNPGTLVRFHLDTGVQDQPKPVSLSFTNGTSAIFVDPSLFLDSSGILHLFYLPGISGQDPAQCPTGQSTCTKHIMSATETAGSDGGSFIVDPGTRADYSVNQCCFSDPAVFQGPAGYYLYTSEGQAVLAFDSPSLAGSYSQIQGLSNAVLVPQGTGGVPAGYYDNSSGAFWTFITQGQNVQVIARAATASLSSPVSSSSFSTILSGCNFPGLGCSYMVASPGFHLNTSGPASTTSTSASTTSTTASGSGVRTEINWEGVGVAISPRNASAVRYNVADSAVLQLPDGTFRMYYGNFSEPVDQYSVCPPDCPAGTGIDSAVSKDGIHWAVEPGTRIKTQQYGPPAINSVIQLANGTIRLYSGQGNVYSSNDGLSFTELSRTVQVAGASCPGCGLQGPGSYTIVPLADGQYRMYMDQTFNGTDPRYTVIRIYSYISSDGFSFTQESGVRLDSPLQYGSSVIRSGGHPLVYQLANGTWIMYFDSRSVNPQATSYPGDPSVNPNPVCVAMSKDGLNWNVARPTFVQSGEAYQATTASSGIKGMIFGYYGQPHFPLPSYATSYGGGLYYALPFYHVISGSNWYSVGVSTTSGISSWTFSSAAKQTTFKVASAVPSFLNLTIPSAVLSGAISVSIDGAPAGDAATTSFNGTANRIYAVFPSGDHTISVSGTSGLQTVTATTSTQAAQSSGLTSTSTTVARTSTSDTSGVFTTTSSGASASSTSPIPQSTVTTSTTGAAGGGIPEFPYQLLATAVLTILVLSSFLLVRHRLSSGEGDALDRSQAGARDSQNRSQDS